MAEDIAELLSRALKLPAPERAALADSLLESLDPEVDEDAEDAWRKEIAIRLQEIESGAVRAVPWDEVRSRIRDRFSR